jgi:putative hemin transport protein
MDGIAASWIVRKPSRDGIVTSLEIFDSEGRQIAWLFGQRKPGEPELSAWRQIVDRLPRMIRQ